eukprot:CAMPEP_0113329466 /NCGR_PEP_ID=MMETSP0010_2-20120614/20924_1 /TAXON_ID=216773 ORGANISM="Corethron hystrix, Strain 308" /NCGR_SAMPLE_ID=MMETSP0010_2 /ASSEMBLY_ACC=CAM_ASM_000155 /LENGTH=572 /DNA_ID=CAMNT_0000191575 /DNA_START=182 /DNA_END=1898 /DNA_ORIENTATION=+ /assembly_acc=CAM_ASM_000155
MAIRVLNEETTTDAQRKGGEERTPRGEQFGADLDSGNLLLSFLQRTVFLGLPVTPSIVAIATVYLVEGGLGLSRLAQQFLLKDQLHLSPAELSAWSGLLILPWTIKPLYGFLSDTVPIFGYRRRAYLMLMGVIGSAAYAVLATDYGGWDPLSGSIWGIIVALLLSSASIAVCDVVADGIVVELTQKGVVGSSSTESDTSALLSADDQMEKRLEEEQQLSGALQSLCWGCAAFGGLASAYFSGSLIESVGPRGVFGYAAFMPLAVAFIAAFIEEEPVSRVPIMQASGEATIIFLPSNGVVEDTDPSEVLVKRADADVPLLETLKSPDFDSMVGSETAFYYRPALFLFLWKSTPSADSAMLYFLTEDLGFGPEFLGRVRLVTAAAGLIGVFIYQKYLRTVPIKDIMFWTSLASCPLGLTQLLLITHVNRELGIPDGAFLFGDDAILTVLGQVAFMPTLVLAARLCPPGIESTLFATLMSMYNAAGSLGTEAGALLTKQLGVTATDFTNLGLLTIICNVSSLYPLLFIGWLDEAGAYGEIDERKDTKVENKDIGTINGSKVEIDTPQDLDKNKKK